MMRHLSRHARALTFVGLVAAGSAATAIGFAQQRAAGTMATAANAFLASLSPDVKQKLSFPLQSDEWTRWHFIPPSMFARNGVPLKDMTEPQRQLARELLQVSLSQAGFNTASAIMANESVLGLMEAKQREANVAAGKAPGQEFARNPQEYFVSIFGTPSASGQWGWRLEGHHVSLHFAVDGARTRVSSTPMFFGANPGVVPDGFPEAGRRLLPVQEDLARELLVSLNDTQRTAAVIAPNAPGDIVTGTQVKPDPKQLAGNAPGRGGRAAEPPRDVPVGIAAAQLTPAQRDLLMKLIDAYTGAMLPEVAAERMGKIREAGTDKIYFAWWGPAEKGKQYYYRLQGPTFLAEHNNTQNNGNHVHQVWRDFNGDFGRDLLAEHMAMYRH